MPFPLNPSNDDIHMVGNKFFIFKDNIGWIQEEPTNFFVQSERPTANIDPTRVAVWFNDVENVIYFWEDSTWIPYFTAKCT